VLHVIDFVEGDHCCHVCLGFRRPTGAQLAGWMLGRLGHRLNSGNGRSIGAPACTSIRLAGPTLPTPPVLRCSSEAIPTGRPGPAVGRLDG